MNCPPQKPCREGRSGRGRSGSSRQCTRNLAGLTEHALRWVYHNELEMAEWFVKCDENHFYRDGYDLGSL